MTTAQTNLLSIVALVAAAAELPAELSEGAVLDALDGGGHARDHGDGHAVIEHAAKRGGELPARDGADGLALHFEVDATRGAVRGPDAILDSRSLQSKVTMRIEQIDADDDLTTGGDAALTGQSWSWC